MTAIDDDIMHVFRLTYTIAIEDGAFESVRDSTLVLADSESDARDAIDIQVERVTDEEQ